MDNQTIARTTLEPSAHDTTSSDLDPTPTGRAQGAEQTLVDDEVLVEEISIDGMCGVY